MGQAAASILAVRSGMVALFLFLVSALAGPVAVLELRGSVDPGTADYIAGGFAEAQAMGASAVVVRLDTPGGLLQSARDIVQAELTAEVPVVVYVEPSGARAGSAGVFVTMAAHVAAMAPGTTIGAAHPVSLMGGGEQQGEDQDRVMEDKILEDTMAWARAIAEKRGRSVEWAERAVRESDALTATEAVDVGAVDVVAPDLDALLAAIDGWEVETPSGTVTLETAGAEQVEIAMSIRQSVLHVLGNPNVLFALIVLGMLGLYTEFYNPGLIIPGAVGVLCLVGAGVGLAVIPFNAGGLLLLLVGFGCFALEPTTPTFGALTSAGVVAVLLGGALLFDVSGFDLSVHPALLAGVAAVAGAAVLAVAWLVVRDRAMQPATGAEGLVGMTGAVLVGGADRGRVRVHGEDWAATWPGVLEPPQPVQVQSVDGLTLHVTPVAQRSD